MQYNRHLHTYRLCNVASCSWHLPAQSQDPGRHLHPACSTGRLHFAHLSVTGQITRKENKARHGENSTMLLCCVRHVPLQLPYWSHSQLLHLSNLPKVTVAACVRSRSAARSRATLRFGVITAHQLPGPQLALPRFWRCFR